MRRTQTLRRLRGLLAIGTLVWCGGVVGAATVSEIAAVPYLTEKGREGYAKFLVAEPARAFAVAENGAWGYGGKLDTRSRAMASALYRCNKAARNICRIYAINEDVVYPRYAAFEDRSAPSWRISKQRRFGSPNTGVRVGITAVLLSTACSGSPIMRTRPWNSKASSPSRLSRWSNC